MNEQCPIWGTPCEKVEFISGHDERTSVPPYDSARVVTSSPRAGGDYVITDNAVSAIQGWTKQENLLKVKAKLSRWVYEKNLLGELPEVTSQILKEAKNWPMPPVSKQMDYLLEFIDSEAGGIGMDVPTSEEMQAATLTKIDKELRFLINQAEKSGLIEVPRKVIGGGARVNISALGYEHLEELRAARAPSNQALSAQAFIAMWFDGSMDEVLEKGFEPGIEDAGYEPFRIDRKPHNNKIDDEIITEIKRSRFLVADFTSERGGVYYEAGFAKGLNIPVIFTCRKDKLENIHFDTRQFKHILWDEPKGLRKELKKTIVEIIGSGPYRKNQKPA